MMRAIDPALHQSLNVEATGSNVFTDAAVGITHGLDPNDRTRPIAPFVSHLLVGSHVLGMPIGGGCQFGADRQRRQLGISS